MPLTAPDWLTKHGGAIRRFPDGIAWAVLIDGRPEYALTPVPAEGKHSCEVMQTTNGRRLDSCTVYDSEEDALRGGLEELRRVLGW